MGIDQDLLKRMRDALDYNTEKGVFVWKVSPSNRVKVGGCAGGLDSRGYSVIRFDGKYYKAHRLAWLFTYGEWPNGDIDHIDGNRDNNRLVNLRDVSKSVNQQNQRIAHSGNTTGILGVSWFKRNNKFQAQITLNGKVKNLGYFTTAEAAHAAYLAAKREIHEGCMI